MHERAIGDSFAQPEIRKEIVSRQTLKIFAQRGSQRRFFRRAFTVGEAQRAFFVANMYRPDVRDGIQPRGFFNLKTEVEQFLLEASDGVFQSGIFAGDKCLRHENHFCRTESAQ